MHNLNVDPKTAQAAMREAIDETMKKTDGDPKASFRRMVKALVEDRAGLEMRILGYTVMPMMLERDKEVDPEFYYETRSELKSIAAMFERAAHDIREGIERSSMKKAPSDA